MTVKQLGKITFAEFGVNKDYPFLIGLQLGFKLSDKSYIGAGGKYIININPNCKWESEKQRTEAITKTVEFVNDILKAAKVHYVSELINIPVEVTIENNCFKDFRILTEVL